MASSRKPKSSAKVAVITGANRGIGLAIAEEFAAAGWNIAITGRDAKRLKQAEQSLRKQSVEVIPQVCDVRDAAQVETFFAAIRRRFGRIDVLVNNAGIFQKFFPIENTSPELWNDVIATNLTGAVWRRRMSQLV